MANNKIVIIGGGPAGMLAAIAASKNITSPESGEVILIEKNEKLGKKLFITGKGRCNVTNNCEKDEFFKNIVNNNKFLYSAFSKFSNADLIKLLNDNGCDTKVERGNRVFPVSDKSYDVTDAFKRILKSQGVKILLNTEVLDISRGLVVTTDKSKIEATKVIVATGGLSYKSTGSTGDGYNFAKKLGINVKDTRPSLVPLKVRESDECKKLKGLNLKNITVKYIDNGKTVYSDFGELLYEDGYLDGPTIISASSYLDDKEYILSIDLKPALDEKKLDARLIREIDENKFTDARDLLKKLLPLDMVDIFICRLENRSLDRESRKKIVSLLKDFRYTINGRLGYDEAIITQGGIDPKEIDPKTMESKKIKGLFFAGEVLDIDGLTGGFNIQIAATTGYTAGLDGI